MIDTPELVFLIGQHLHPADLRRCAQVSQLWHETLIPWLWRELDDSERPWYQMFDEVETLLGALDDSIMLPFEIDPRLRPSEIIHKYGHHIRRLRITHIWTLDPREESISQGLHTHLKFEDSDPDYIEDTIK
ncbi:hypothetical protein BG006_004137 [Podila minutissima]|uniref:F-box domain-containing protein n=1 Tax=Podila minutissima TaxID=64525 RepID=A0A9P5VFY4_9FUNG|nr:hypothetical protein BG006_004137 [Podila minutissima]